MIDHRSIDPHDILCLTYHIQNSFLTLYLFYMELEFFSIILYMFKIIRQSLNENYL